MVPPADRPRFASVTVGLVETTGPDGPDLFDEPVHRYVGRGGVIQFIRGVAEPPS